MVHQNVIQSFHPSNEILALRNFGVPLHSWNKKIRIECLLHTNGGHAFRGNVILPKPHKNSVLWFHLESKQCSDQLLRQAGNLLTF